MHHYSVIHDDFKTLRGLLQKLEDSVVRYFGSHQESNSPCAQQFIEAPASSDLVVSQHDVKVTDSELEAKSCSDLTAFVKDVPKAKAVDEAEEVFKCTMDSKFADDRSSPADDSVFTKSFKIPLGTSLTSISFIPSVVSIGCNRIADTSLEFIVDDDDDEENSQSNAPQVFDNSTQWEIHKFVTTLSPFSSFQSRDLPSKAIILCEPDGFSKEPGASIVPFYTWDRCITQNVLAPHMSLHFPFDPGSYLTSMCKVLTVRTIFNLSLSFTGLHSWSFEEFLNAAPILDLANSRRNLILVDDLVRDMTTKRAVYFNLLQSIWLTIVVPQSTQPHSRSTRSKYHWELRFAANGDTIVIDTWYVGCVLAGNYFKKARVKKIIFGYFDIMESILSSLTIIRKLGADVFSSIHSLKMLLSHSVEMEVSFMLVNITPELQVFSRHLYYFLLRYLWSDGGSIEFVHLMDIFRPLMCLKSLVWCVLWKLSKYQRLFALYCSDYFFSGCTDVLFPYDPGSYMLTITSSKNFPKGLVLDMSGCFTNLQTTAIRLCSYYCSLLCELNLDPTRRCCAFPCSSKVTTQVVAGFGSDNIVSLILKSLLVAIDLQIVHARSTNLNQHPKFVVAQLRRMFLAEEHLLGYSSKTSSNLLSELGTLKVACLPVVDALAGLPTDAGAKVNLMRQPGFGFSTYQCVGSTSVVTNTSTIFVGYVEYVKWVHKNKIMAKVYAYGFDTHFIKLLGSSLRLEQCDKLQGAIVLIFPPSNSNGGEAKKLLESVMLGHTNSLLDTASFVTYMSFLILPFDRGIHNIFIPCDSTIEDRSTSFTLTSLRRVASGHTSITNLEDKVLIGDRGIVMNHTQPNMGTAIGQSP